MTNETQDAIIQKVFGYIDQMAAIAGNAAQYGWGLMLRQAYVQLAFDIFVLVLTVIFPLAAYKIVKFYSSRKDERDRVVEDDVCTTLCFLAMLLFGLTLVCSIYTLFHIQEIFVLIINPEYWVIQNIIHTFK